MLRWLESQPETDAHLEAADLDTLGGWQIDCRTGVTDEDAATVIRFQHVVRVDPDVGAGGSGFFALGLDVEVLRSGRNGSGEDVLREPEKRRPAEDGDVDLVVNR